MGSLVKICLKLWSQAFEWHREKLPVLLLSTERYLNLKKTLTTNINYVIATHFLYHNTKQAHIVCLTY